MIRGEKFLNAIPSLAITLTSVAAWAQAPSGTVALEEIVVTAEKRAENLQEVPKQVQVVTTENLQNANVTSINDLVKLIPSMTGPNNNAMGGNTSMRGVGTAANSLGANSKVGIVLDDIPMPSRAPGAKNLLDVSQVEVLPGPQGTLAGRNATGGLINIVTRKPSRSDLTGVVQLGATDDHEYTAGGYVSAPLGDQFAFSLSTNYQDLRGLAYNLALKKWDITTRNYGVRTKLLWAPSDDTEVIFTYSHDHDRTEGGGVNGWANIFSKITIPLNQIFTPLECVNVGGTCSFAANAPGRLTFTQLLPGITPSPDNVNYYSPNRQWQVRDTDMGILKLERTFAPGTLTVVGSMLSERYPAMQNFYAYPTTVNMDYRPEFDGFAHVYNLSKSNTAEARFASNTDQSWRYLAGLFWSDVKNIYDYQRILPTFMADRRFGMKSKAAFASTSYTFPTETTVRVGARYEKDNVNFSWNFYDLPATTKTLQNGIVRTYAPYTKIDQAGNASDDFVNYDFGLQQKLGEDAMVYLNYGHANQGPLYDAENTVDSEAGTPLQLLPSEEVNSIELGLKSEWFARRLQFNVNVFSMKFKNYQAATNVADPLNPQGTPQLKLWAAGEVSSKGVEVTSSALITDKFRFDLAGMYNKAQIDDWKNAPCYNTLQTLAQGCITGVPPGEFVSRRYQANIAGNWLADAPRYKATAVGTYSDSLFSSSWDYDAAVTVRYNSETRGDQLGNPVANLPSRTFVDANLTFTTGDIQLSLYGINLFEEFAETFGTGLGYGLSIPANYSVNQNPDGSWPVTTRNLNRDNVRYFGVRVRYSF